jgi:hypothetical protein
MADWPEIAQACPVVRNVVAAYGVQLCGAKKEAKFFYIEGFGS